MKRVLFLILIVVTGCKSDKKYHDVKVQEEVMTNISDKVSSVVEFQNKLNEEFKNPETSPLKDKDRSEFSELDFFPIDTNFIVKAKLTFTPDAEVFFMPTTTDRKTQERLYAVANFKIKDVDYNLNIYQSMALLDSEEYKDYLFLPFSDLTNGDATYGGGRYIDLRIPEGDEIVIDFNKAYNPYCAYNKKFSCPIVPNENNLSLAVKAGVKKFK
ncbi:hypothetical protein SAMN04487906_1273 [Zhouia amylolytica]|uniref:DUF1684 domain-containing protein n=2 Tax=Zhouia amylolytica TaxID=376730 RepID=W2UPF6_9FLAO|nr:DUF1684 domain-containing protein [Zhouia amylolytica]ETN95222.1 hypothetical protein P278_19770 [Zhouia amylolytica AD3]MCQ0111934.1 DUF1684 domain-containing protein [Zhouia amylolytica]SFS67472.1 hypothetical protein SAMN04487906_1273 [Zhouia amylolytica]